ncbi:MAG: DUF3536 domain-containing protein [Candidatus Omnitrophica bacterium]|nr:DUF3536 domain-containing protein [Candidatus Omnitrophota bacterium]
MEKYICIHGHFYQPPRENSWLDAIEIQDSAHPYRDWNERITAECYEPNSASRILDTEERIVDIVNNYSKMSFNFGPTLLSWMQHNSPKVYQAILDADKESLKRFNGHGSAIAQVYNHIIMPLANTNDKYTQILWGIKDFEYRFARKPEGMWLAETAVDLQTLDLLVEMGIKYTILSPYQAAQIKPLGFDDQWKDIVGAKIDPKIPYLCKLPSGKNIIIFFYDGPISQDVAFGDVLKNGEGFAHRLLSVFPDHSDMPLLSHIATDGETYGHHQKFGNMALSYLFDHVERNNLAKITVYGEFLEKCPPKFEVKIIERSAWSCSHGVGRWEKDCGCCIAKKAGWNQKWRSVLRDTMNWLRDELVRVFDKEMTVFTNNPWLIRNKYIDVVLDRSTENIEKFFQTNFKESINAIERVKILKLLEMQRYALLMFTSCGWFFDDISGLEPVQIMQYAARAMQLANDVAEIDLEPMFLDKIKYANSNIPQFRDGKNIYLKKVKPAVIDLLKVGAHYAICSLFGDHSKKIRIYAFTADPQKYQRETQGKQILLIGQAFIRSEMTTEGKMIEFAVLHLGDHNITCGLREHVDQVYFDNMCSQITKVFKNNDVPELIKLINSSFGAHTYTLWDLFQHEQGLALNKIFEETVELIEANFRQIYDQYYPLMQLRDRIRVPLPKPLAMTVEFILNRDLMDTIEDDNIDVSKLERLVNEMLRWGFMRDKETISLKASKRISILMEKMKENPEDTLLIGNIESIIRLLNRLSFTLDIWRAQNIYFKIGKAVYHLKYEKAVKNDVAAKFWIESFDKLGKVLQVKLRR